MRKIVKVSVKSTLVAILLTVFLVVLVSATKGIATHNYHASFTQMVSDSNLRDSSLIEHGIKGYFKNDDGIVVCSICDESIYPDPDSYGYDFEEHLLTKHNISKETVK